jgi:hypothetical protein
MKSGFMTGSVRDMGGIAVYATKCCERYDRAIYTMGFRLAED